MNPLSDSRMKQIPVRELPVSIPTAQERLVQHSLSVVQVQSPLSPLTLQIDSSIIHLLLLNMQRKVQ